MSEATAIDILTGFIMAVVLVMPGLVVAKIVSMARTARRKLKHSGHHRAVEKGKHAA